MKRLAVPTLASAAAAALSILFYAGFARLAGDVMLGEVILTLSSVALLQIAVVPQVWVYIVAAHEDGEIDRRYGVGVVLELLGGLAGLALLLGALALPLRWLDGYRGAALWQYLALWLAGSTAAQGWFRAHEDWRRYAAWVVLPNLVRAALVAAALAGWLAVGSGRAMLTFAFFFVPELARWLPLNLPLLVARFRLQPRGVLIEGSRRALQNWLFDIGSALTEVADKVVVGALLGPQLLVVYFFARKVGVAATMVVEPVYAESYRRIMRGEIVRSPLLTGMAVALAVAAALLAGFAAVLHWPLLARVVPAAVAENAWLFAALVVIDALVAANRWSRFLSQLRGRAPLLLVVRLALFAGFAGLLAAWSGGAHGWGLLAAFAAFWFAEVVFVASRLGRMARA